MATSTCAACQRPCRKKRLAYVADPKGGLSGQRRVCQACFDRALHIVPSVVAIQKGVDEVKVQRRESASVMGAAIKKLRLLSKAYAAKKQGLPNEIDSNLGRADGLDQAADLLEAGDF